jgi:hypothetical protein
MRLTMFPWLGQQFVALSWEGDGEGTVAEETHRLFERFSERLGGFGLGLEHTVRTRLWVRDIDCWHLDSKVEPRRRGGFCHKRDVPCA